MANTIYLNGLTFQVLPQSGATPSASADFLTKAYGDATYATIAGEVTAGGDNTFTGTNTFNTHAVTFGVAPVMSGASIASGTIPVASVVGTAAALSANNTFTGNNVFNTGTLTFSVAPTMSGANISAASIPDASLSSNVALLNGIQTFSAVKTFSAIPVFSNATAAFTYNQGSSLSGKVLTSDGSGNATWVAPAGGGLRSASVATSSTSATTLISVAIPSNGVVTLSGSVNAATTTTYADATGGEFNVTAVSVSGTAVIVGSPIVNVNAQTTGTFNASVSGSNLVIQVTAPSATGYSWNSTYYSLLN